MSSRKFMEKGRCALKANETVRKAARTANVPLWRVAAELGISEPTLTRWLRFPLTPDKEAAMLAAISELEKEVDR